jgi:S-adenosylmethionine decarboxylase
MKDLFPKSKVDHFLFDPCGYSLNGLQGPYYWTVHVTPEAHCSYASLETNIPIGQGDYATYEEVIRKVVDVFKPGKFTCTVFTRKPPGQEREESDSESTSSGTHSLAASTLMHRSETPSPRPPVSLDEYDKRFGASLFSDGVISREHSRMLLGCKNLVSGFTRRDRIVYDLGRWDLVFANFSQRFKMRQKLAPSVAKMLPVEIIPVAESEI